MNYSEPKIPLPENEPQLSYAPGSPERISLKEELARQSSVRMDVPVIINGVELKTGHSTEIRSPHDHNLILGNCFHADESDCDNAVKSALSVKKEWSALPWYDRATVFFKAAELLSGKYRFILNSATMLGQSKTAFQAEIDSACELIDFWRFNPYFMQSIYGQQPLRNSPGCLNRVEYRPLEGFIYAVSPFNFTAIGGNLSTAPVMMGNVAIWKPATNSVLSAYWIMKILKEAGLPDGVIQFLPGSGKLISSYILNHPEFAGLHFTGSNETFKSMWSTVSNNLQKGIYRQYPRLIGETGGKDFIFAAPDANVENLSLALFKGAFEYQGQKCSAASRAYIPESIWPQVKEYLGKLVSSVKVGDVKDFRTFMGAVIDRNSYKNIVSYIDEVKKAGSAEIVFGGTYCEDKGWFIDPTVVKVSDPYHRLMQEELFGPVLSIYVYSDQSMDNVVDILNNTSPFGLTGAIFSQNRMTIKKLSDLLIYSAGNLYVNDKPTGAVVGQQPFGGSRASGTNDKAGSPLNLMRWTSPRTVKENLNAFEVFPHVSMTES